MKIMSVRMPLPGLLLMVPLILLACSLTGSEEATAVPEVAPTEEEAVDPATATSEAEPTAEPTAMPEEPTATSEPSPTPEEPAPTATMEQAAATPGSDPAPTAVPCQRRCRMDCPTCRMNCLTCRPWPIFWVFPKLTCCRRLNDPSANLSAVAEALGVDELALRIALEAAGVSLP